MRIRTKPWARPELAACPYFTEAPVEFMGEWRKRFARPEQPLHIELGCGKGGFMAQLAPSRTDINFMALDIKYEMLGMARRKIAEAYKQSGLEADNIMLVKTNIESIVPIFNASDSVYRIYINFCNPWPKPPDKKHRLTYTRHLMKYRTFLCEDGEIRFKTDNDGLFDESLGYFKECGFEIEYLTRDLHGSDFSENILTEHEKMFSEEGIPIKMLIARKKPLIISE